MADGEEAEASMRLTGIRQLVFAGTFVMAVTALMTQSSAQTSGQAPPERGYYVVLDSNSKTCSVVDKEPKTDTAHITVATDAVYATRTEAEAAIATLKPCMK